MGRITMTKVAEAMQSIRVVLPDHYMYMVNFLDNHDKTLLMEAVKGDIAMFKNAYAMLIYTEGIPLVYYLDVRGTSGFNREPFWNITVGPREQDLERFFQLALQYRRHLQLWEYPQQEAYADQHHLVLARGPVLLLANNVQAGNKTAAAISGRTNNTLLWGQTLTDVYNTTVSAWGHCSPD